MIAFLKFNSVYELAGFVLAYLVVFYYLFIFAMGVYRAWLAKRLSKLQLVLLSPPILILAVIDVVFNYTIGSAIFRCFPPAKNWTLSQRLKTYNTQTTDDWKKKVANYVCENMLDIFDPTGDHC